jgi:RNA polymerase sigma factor (sigma-70 family)
MAEPAGELEDLGPPGDGKVARARQRPAQAALNLRAKVALFVGVTVFTVGALAQVFATLWLGLLVCLLGGSAEVLVHTGGLEPRTFAACSVAAVVLDAILLIVIAATSLHRSWPRRSPPPRERFAVRHPVIAAGLGLSCALAFVLVFGWEHSVYFPYPLATVIVLANAYFFGLVGVVASARLADLAWRQVKAWGLASQYRTGFLTASLLLLGAVGYWRLTTRWYAEPLDAIEARIEAEDLGDVTGVLDGELDGLCIVAGQLEPALAHSAAAAPACGFLSGGSAPPDDCFSSLMKHEAPKAKTILRSSGANDDDLDDAIMEALLATCTRKPPPRSLAGYFFTVVRNQTRQMAQAARREVSCDHADDMLSACAASEPPELREVQLALLWKYAFCKINPSAKDILRLRFEQDQSFRQIGSQLGMTEVRAKDTYHNAIKKLRSLDLGSCVSEEL